MVVVLAVDPDVVRPGRRDAPPWFGLVAAVLLHVTIATGALLLVRHEPLVETLVVELVTLPEAPSREPETVLPNQAALPAADPPTVVSEPPPPVEVRTTPTAPSAVRAPPMPRPPPRIIASSAPVAANLAVEAVAIAGPDSIVSAPANSAADDQPSAVASPAEPANAPVGADAAASDLVAEPAYAASLLAWLERYRRYPRAAQVRGIEGRVVLRLRIAANGRLDLVELERSSGEPLLDAAAIDMARRADPVPALPRGMDGRRLEMLVPVSFSLGT